MIFAASIRFLEGRQPRLTHVPPVARSSVITEVLPCSCARSAAPGFVNQSSDFFRRKLARVETDDRGFCGKVNLRSLNAVLLVELGLNARCACPAVHG